MHTKIFTDYKKFLEYAKENKDALQNIKYFGGRLFSFNTKTYRCKYLIETNVETPNKFVKTLGFENYSAFVHKRFSHLKEFAENKDVAKWFNGYFGGFIGINEKYINNYVGTGEVFTFYDYDINSAYLHALTQFLPTKFVKTITPEEFNQLNEFDKIPFIYFFELEFKTIQTRFLKAVGNTRKGFSSFDFLSSKQNENFICSEKRLSLINQIYFKQYTIKNIYVFERGKFKFYNAILTEYLRQKEFQTADFKKNAMRLYGTFGQIYKYTPKELYFEENGDLKIKSKCVINWESSPQVAMFVADIVAEKLFNIITANFENIVSWCVDGFVSTRKINVKLSKRGGDWKMKKIHGLPYLIAEGGKRIVYKDIDTGEIFGSDCITDKGNYLLESVMLEYSNLHKGFVKKIKKYKIEKNITFDWFKSFRGLIWRDNFYENILHFKSDF